MTQIAEEYGLLFNETSAKNRTNVDETFTELLNIIVAKVNEKYLIKTKTYLQVKKGYQKYFYEFSTFCDC